MGEPAVLSSMDLDNLRPGSPFYSSAVGDAEAARLASYLGLTPQKVLNNVRTNPAILTSAPIDQLSQSISAVASALHLELEKTLQLCSKRPSLLQQPLSLIVQHRDSLAVALSLDDVQASRALCKQPSLFSLNPMEVSSQVARMASAMGVSKGEIGSMLGRTVDYRSLKILLEIPSNMLMQRLISLQVALDSRLGSGRGPNAGPLALRCPQLLVNEDGEQAIVSTLDRVLELIDQLSEERRIIVLKSCPEMLTLTPQQLSLQFRDMLTALRMSQSQLVGVLSHEPRLFKLPPYLLQSRFLALQNLLFIPTSQASSMILRQPQLLAYASETLQARLVSLKNSMRISLDMALVIIARHPNLLCFKPSNLEAKVQHLSTVIGLPPARTVDIILRCPVLLTLSPERLLDSYNSLQSLLLPFPVDANLDDFPRLPSSSISAQTASTNRTQHSIGSAVQPLALAGLTMEEEGSDPNLDPQLTGEVTPGSGRRATSSERNGLGSGERQQGSSSSQQKRTRSRLTDAVQRKPQLLLLAPSKLAEQVSDLSMLLALPKTQVVDMALRKPELLITADLKLWQTNLDTLTTQLGLSVSSARSLIQHWPALGLTDAQKLMRSCSRLRTAMSANPAWLAGLDTAPAPNLRQCLYYGTWELHHVAFLAAHAELAERYPPWHHSVASRKLFCKAHPGFIKWLWRQGRQRKKDLEAKNRLNQRTSFILTSVLGLSPETAASVLRLYPNLMVSKHQERLQANCAALHEVLSSYTPWLLALDSAPPSQIRKCLYYGPKELMHLRFLADSHLQDSCSPCHPILMDRPSFASEYAGFGRWMRQQLKAESNDELWAFGFEEVVEAAEAIEPDLNE
ncbi:hypothetical protein CEUSTIGMA_g1153.t1 [Chlamydomonas eustigma]|uniref:Uncharacterized protein n=1 Tax=Chlamydomonas eustigma TaxID=1157962 RepID=A0A250WSE6_9CHLO|nr:hypothetical protein CEUSTIGMA_g1153.t1 [Chlamydomonas eustigma]|eukprot:GAX73701.1 hypothetical protein CEUSTIGMA_g1153.t1 [Chlamydomonas eustigma]